MSKINEEDAILYILGELDAESQRRIDTAVSTDAESAALVDSYREGLEAFALADSPLKEPGDGLLASVLAEVSEIDDTPVKKPVPISIPILPWAAAACFAVFAGVGITTVGSQRDQLAEENALLRSQVEASDLRVRELASQVDASFKAFIVWDDVRGTGVLKVDNLPALGTDGDYQLWVVSDGYDQPLDGGVFDTENGKAEIQILTRELAKDPAKAENVTLFAISRERAGGVPVSETKDFVLTAKY